MSRNEKKMSEEYDGLSHNNCKCLKGVFAVFVLIHHLYQYTTFLKDYLVGGIFQLLGYLSVAVFFFLSGYGLMAQYVAKGDAYIDGFLRNRLLAFYCTYLLILAVNILSRLVLEGRLDTSILLKSFLFGGTLVYNGWYFQVILMFYITFFGVFKFCRKEYLKLPLMAVFVTAYCILCYIIGMSGFWYVTSLTFVLGMIWRCGRSRICVVLSIRYNYFLLIIGTVVVFCVTVLLGYGGILPDIPATVLKVISAALFASLCAMIAYRANLNNLITRALGNVYLEIYAVQGIALRLFRSDYIYIKNDYFYIASVTGSVVIMACLLNPVILFVNKIIKRPWLRMSSKMFL